MYGHQEREERRVDRRRNDSPDSTAKAQMCVCVSVSMCVCQVVGGERGRRPVKRVGVPLVMALAMMMKRMKKRLMWKCPRRVSLIKTADHHPPGIMEKQNSLLTDKY